MTITTNSGESHSTRVDVLQGDPRDPMTKGRNCRKIHRARRRCRRPGAMQEVAEPTSWAWKPRKNFERAL